MPYCDERFVIKNNEPSKTKTDENEQMSLNGDPDTDPNANGQGMNFLILVQRCLNHYDPVGHK